MSDTFDRRRLLTNAGALAALGTLWPSTPWSADADAATESHDDDRGSHIVRVRVDVACDARTFQVNTGLGPADPAVKRGDSFMVRGKIYRGGTIPPGGTLDMPGPFDIDTAPGAIGDWICRGVFNFDIGDIFAGAAPHAFATQFHVFRGGASLVSDGAEGGMPTLRAVIGGTGAYRGARGEATEQAIGVNRTGLFNLQFVFKLDRHSIA